MNAQQRHLYAQLVQWHPDDAGSSFPFSKRLARENGWTTAHARRVIEEYKRFVFLALHAGHPVTPSDSVDQAWHLHLTYTRSYWEDLCENILHQRLHHTPTKGGRGEKAKYAGLYGRTLQSYRDFFGEAPPADIWPAPGARFEPAPHQRWVDARQYWLVSKPLRNLTHSRETMLVVGAGAVLMGCATTGNRSEEMVTLSMLGVFFLIFAAALYRHYRRQPRRATSGGSGDAGGSWSSDGGGGAMAGTAAAAGFAGMAGGEFGGGSSGSYGDGSDGNGGNGDDNGGDGGDGGGDGGDGGGGCSGCGGCGGGD
jgi:hypothetical protein